MSNLIPELRVDKNGRLVTKHVRAIAKGSDAKKLPAPALGATPTRAEKENRIRTVLSGISIHKGITRERMEATLWDMNPDVFRRLEKLAEGNEETDFWQDTHRWLIRGIIDEPSEEKQVMYLNAIEALGDDYQEWADVRTLNSLRKIPEFAPYADDFREAPDDIKEAAHRLGDYRNELAGFYQLYTNTKTSTRLKSRALEALIINDPDKSSALIDWVADHRERNTTEIDSELALRVINNPHERSAIASLLAIKMDNRVIGLVLDRPESTDEIVRLYGNGETRYEAIIEVIDGNVKSSLASGIL